MKLYEVKNLLKAEVLCGEECLDREVSRAFGCDLLSDVLAFTMPDNLLFLTGLTNNQVINIAEMVDAVAVVFVRGKIPSDEIIEIARSKNIPLLTTRYMLYDSCGILYKHDLKGCGKVKVSEAAF